VCRALRVLCVAADPAALAALRRSTVGAEWELLPGATGAADALAQLEAERPHVLVAFGAFEDLVREARARYPALRIVTDRPAAGSDEVASSLEEVRPAILGLPRPGGPVR
jgi:hypothetical protein